MGRNFGLPVMDDDYPKQKPLHKERLRFIRFN
jgi:hypothetical protein